MSGVKQHEGDSGNSLNTPFAFEGGQVLFKKLLMISNLSSAGGVLDYDQACFLPDQAADERAQQIGAIAEVVHEHATAISFRDQINDLHERRSTFTSDDRRNIEVLKRDLDHELKLPTAFVVEKANLQSAGYNAWETAKASGDWKSILPIFEHWQKL